MLDLRLLAILDPLVLGDRDPLAAARAAGAGGATALQLRAKTARAGPLVDLVRILVATVQIPVWVNDRADVALAAGAAGVHLGQDDLPAVRVRPFAPRPFGIGLSVGTPDEARAVAGAPVDYWSLGPVFPTATKPDAGPALGPDGFRALARRAPGGMPVIAIGGITADNAPEVIRTGAAGVAVVSAVFAADDIEAAARRVRRAVDSARSRGG